MRKEIAYAVTAAFLLAPIGVSAETRATTDPSARAAMRQDAGVLEQRDQDAIRAALGDVIVQALSRDLEDVVDYLAKPDRDRIEGKTPWKLDANAYGDQFATSFQQRYNSTIANAFGENRIPYRFSGTAEKAQVTIPAADNLPELTLNVVQEGSMTAAWRLDIPDSMDGMELKKNLEVALNSVNKMRSSLPADIKQAEMHAAHHVLAAFSENPGPHQHQSGMNK